MNEFQKFLPAATDLAVQAGRRTMELLKDPLIRQTKADHSLVTNADHAANDILRSGLRRAFPTHSVLSEETGTEGPADAPFVWLVDPLDGTRAYAKGIPGFSVMLGLVFQGQPVLGVVYDPLEDRLYEAARGSGAFLTTKGGAKTPLRVSARDASFPVIVSTGFPDPLQKQLAPSLPGAWLPPINSVGIKVGFVVRGEADVYIGHHPVHTWDTAGPQAILEEAGGRFTYWDGQPLRYDQGISIPGPTVATNTKAHAAAVKALGPIHLEPSERH